MSQAARTALIYNLTGQVVQLYLPEQEVITYGPPTAAAAYSAWRGDRSNDDTAEFSGTATLDAVSTTVSAAAGASQAIRRQVTLTSVSNIKPRTSYVLANVSGQREIVTPWEVGAAVVKLENELRNDYPITSSTFKGLRHYFTIDSSFIQDAAKINAFTALDHGDIIRRVEPSPPYRLRWRYTTADGIAREHWTYFDVVRQRGTHNVTAADLRAHFPDILDEEWRSQRGQQFAQQIDAGWDRFCFDLRCTGYPIDALREGPVVDELVLRASLMIIAAGGAAPGSRELNDYIRETREDYTRMFERAIGGALKAWIDTGTTGAIDPQPLRQTRLRK